MNNARWNYLHKHKAAPIRPILEREINRETNYVISRLAECSIVRMRTAYLAVEHVNRITMERTVTAVICFLEYRPTETYNFGFKCVNESEVPIHRWAPRNILEALTATTNRGAKEWRSGCWANINRLSHQPRIRAGMMLTHPTGVKFADGATRSRFRVVRKGVYRSIDDGTVVVIDPMTIQQMVITIDDSKQGHVC